MQAARALSALIGLSASFLLVLPVAQAAPITEPIVFDFEDGLQGWELDASAQRVHTQILGGEWAIFGDGSILPTHISLELDITDLAVVTLEQFRVVEGDPRPESDFLVIMVHLLDGGFFLAPLGGDRAASPGVRVFSLERVRDNFPVEGLARLSIHWLGDPGATGFIDNVTFHPIPEPGHLGLLGLLSMLGLRRFTRTPRW